MTAGAPARRGPTDLPFAFPDRGLAQALAAERSEPAWLRDERLGAFQAYEQLPIETNRLYTTYVDLRAADLLAARPYVRTATRPAASDGPADPPPGTAGIIELREDRVARLALDHDLVESGVELETLGAALGRDEPTLRAELEGGSTLPADDKLAQLARGFWSQGVRLDVPAGLRIDRPIVIRWSVGRAGRALLSRSLISIGAGASVSILEEQVASEAPGEHQSLFAGTTEVRMAPGSHLAIAALQLLSSSQIVFQQRHSTLAEGASLRLALAQLGSRLVRGRVDSHLDGDRSSVEQVEIVFGAASQFFDLTSYTRHRGQDTTAAMLSKGAMLDASRVYFKGLATIEKSAVGTDSFLGEFGMHLSKKARSVAIPSLEIDQPNCRRAAHSSSVGPIDPAQLFYLETRGIPPDEARKFIVMGFLEPVVARVPLATEQERLRELLAAKWDASVTAAADAA